MKTFLVGGAVRDQLLGFPVHERDWVVVDGTPEQMLSKGFKPVGKSFPVFLHPETHDEYALARTERKTAAGYKGFDIHAEPGVTLYEDLHRRDLTINAIAQTADGMLIDPYGGQQDLQDRLLRHISTAFCEDPVRILRVARFAARYAHIGFKIAPETLQLMQEMVINGEVDYLVAERVWAETEKALAERTPVAFFESLRDCKALKNIFPEIDQLFGVPQPPKYHPEIDTGLHSFMALEQAARLSDQTTVRFAALVHDLGKALTPPQMWPSHHGHETSGLPVLEKLCLRLRIPNQFYKLAAQVMQYHTHCHRALELRPGILTDMLIVLGAFKPGNNLKNFLLACEADARGRTGFEQHPYCQADLILEAQKVGMPINISSLPDKQFRGEKIGFAIRNLRINAISACKKDFQAKLDNGCD